MSSNRASRADLLPSLCLCRDDIPMFGMESRFFIDQKYYQIHRQEPVFGPPVDFIYIAYLLNRHGISCNPCHAVKARHCLVCHAAPRGMVPDSCGCGSVRVKRRNTPCLGDCQENTTLSGGGQPPPPRKPAGLVDYVACDRFPLLGR